MAILATCNSSIQLFAAPATRQTGLLSAIPALLLHTGAVTFLWGAKMDLTGCRFGKLVVLSRHKKEDDKWRRQFWLCRCDCGGEKITTTGSLRSGQCRSCGCLYSQSNVIDITGKKFGRLTAVEKVDTPKRGKGAYWKCLCDCGRHVVASYGNLKRGNVLSCKCLRSEVNHLPKGEADFNRLLRVYKYRARIRGKLFLLTEQEFRTIILGNCTYCGVPPTRICKIQPYQNRHGSFAYNGIDRKDSSLGYTNDNCVPCCCTCNRAKLAMSVDEFLQWIERVYDHSVSGKTIKI